MADATYTSQRDGLVAITLGGAFFGLYLLTLCRTVFWYDSAEYVTAAVTLGIPHPPGYPLYTILGHLFTKLPVDSAVAVNAMSGTFAAVAVALTYLVCRRLGVDRIPSGIGAATLGGGKLFWANAVVAEVYCPALAVAALVIYLLLHLDLLDRAIAIAGAFEEQLLFVGAALAVIGMVWLWRRRPLECVAFALMSVGNLGFFFRYRVHDLAVFFLPTTLLLCCLVGAGAQTLIDGISRFVSASRVPAMRRLVKGALIAFAGALALGNYRAVDLSDFRETDEFIAAMVSTLPIDAVILNYTTPPEWKLDAVFGMYVQKVLGQRTDVDVVIPIDPGLLQAAMQSGRPVYAYVPVAQLARNFELAPHGPIFRVLGPRH